MHVDERDGPSGRPFRRALLLIALTLALGACSSGGDQSTPNPSPTQSLALRAYELGARAPTAKGTAVVYAFDPAVAATSSASPDAGNKFVAIDVEGCAGSKADATTGVDPGLFYLLYSAEPTTPVEPGVKKPALHKTALAAGRCARGWITFEIPEAATPKYAFIKTAGARIAWILTK